MNPLKFLNAVLFPDPRKIEFSVEKKSISLRNTISGKEYHLNSKNIYDLLVFAMREGLTPQTGKRMSEILTQYIRLSEDEELGSLWELFKKNMLRNTAHIELQLEFLTKFIRISRENNFRYMIYKGIPLSEEIFDHPGYRQSTDIDVWIHPEDIFSFLKETAQLKFKYEYPSHKISEQTRGAYIRSGRDFCLYHQDSKVKLDIQSVFISPTLTSLKSSLAIFKDKKKIRIREMDINVPSIPDHLILLAIHGTHHAWNKYSLIMDFAGLYHKCHSSMIERAMDRADKLKLSADLYVAIELVKRFFPSMMSNQFEFPINESKLMKLNELIDTIYNDFNSDDWKTRRRRNLFNYELMSRHFYMQRFNAMIYHIFTPSFIDIMRFPRLAECYWILRLLRPLRLLSASIKNRDSIRR